MKHESQYIRCIAGKVFCHFVEHRTQIVESWALVRLIEAIPQYLLLLNDSDQPTQWTTASNLTHVLPFTKSRQVLESHWKVMCESSKKCKSEAVNTVADLVMQSKQMVPYMVSICQELVFFFCIFAILICFASFVLC